MKRVLTIKNYFEDSWLFSRVLAIPAMIGFAINQYVGFSLGALTLVVYASTNYKMEIDKDNHLIIEFLSFAGIRTNSLVSHFNKLNYVYLNKINNSSYKYFLSTDAKNYYLGEDHSLKAAKKNALRFAGKLELNLKKPDS